MINPQLAKSVMMWWLQCLIWWSNAPVFHKLAPIAHLKFTDIAFCSSAPTTATSGRSKSSLDLWMARVSPHIAIQSYSMLQYSYVNYQQKTVKLELSSNLAIVWGPQLKDWFICWCVDTEANMCEHDLKWWIWPHCVLLLGCLLMCPKHLKSF